MTDSQVNLAQLTPVQLEVYKLRVQASITKSFPGSNPEDVAAMLNMANKIEERAW